MREYYHVVQYYETDKMGIAHHSNYIRWMEEARADFLVQAGWPFDRLEAMGLVSPVIGLDIKYFHSTTFSDKVRIETRLIDFGIAKFKVAYKMFCHDRCVCEGHSEHGLVAVGGRPIRINEKFPDFYNCMLSELEKDKL